MSFLLGLTGSIGMGKSTTAQLFADCGCKIWDADSTVHRAYSKNGTAVAGIAKIAPDAVLQGAVDRARLRALISQDASLLPKLEAIIHPLVKQDRRAFIANNPKSILVFDIPVTEKLIETMITGKELIFVTQVVLAEMPSGITVGLQQFSNRWVLWPQTNICAGQAHFQQACSQRMLSSDKCRASCSTALLAVVVG